MKDIEVVFYNNSNEDYINDIVLEKNNQSIFTDYIESLNLNYDSIYLEYSFISSDDMIKLNIESLDHEYDTDILSFDLSLDDNNLFGNFYLSYNKIVENSKEYETVIYQELNRVIIHGFLHLIGFNDHTEEDIALIRNEENKFLEYIKRNVPRGT